MSGGNTNNNTANTNSVSNTGTNTSANANTAVTGNASSGTGAVTKDASNNSSANTTANNSSSAASTPVAQSSNSARAISSIDQSWKGTNVTISAVVIKKYDSEKNGKTNKFMTIAEPGKNSATMKAVLFDTAGNPSTASKLDESYANGTPLVLNGKIDVYKGELEIIVKNIGK